MPNMELILALLAAATLLSGVSRLVDIPYPIVLVIGGAVLAAVPGIPNVRITPNVVFLVFLPPLLYSAALTTSPGELRDNAVTILILAIGLVLATVALVAAVAHFAAGVTWPMAFVLGAILGATDPIAATAIIRRLGAPPRIAILLEGEALVNDGTSLTAFKVAVSAASAGSFSLAHGALQFVAVSAGGAIVGGGVGWLSVAIRRRMDDPNLEVAIGVLTGYAAYIAADRLGVSGVLAAVTAGLVVARRSSEIFSPGSRLRSYAFWQVTEFILNALLFLLVGLQLRSVLSGIQGAAADQLAWQSAAVVGVLIALRVAWMYVVPVLLPWLHRAPAGEEADSWRPKLVLGWSGMRGALSIAAALSLPLVVTSGGTLPDRSRVIFLAFAATFVMLVLPGLTLSRMIRWLGLAQSETQMRQATEARLKVLRAGLSRLDELAETDDISEQTVARLRERLEGRAGALELQLGDERGHDRAATLREERRAGAAIRDAQRSALQELGARRLASAETLREIERDLDLEASRLREP
jgi:CPA1 family monovalent cation:H+ antiporter